MQVIVDAKGCVVLSFGNSGKRCDSTNKKSTNYGGKRVRSTKATLEYWINDDAVECPSALAKDSMLKHESKFKCMLKEEVKDERKAMHTKSLKAKEEHFHLDKATVLEKND